MSPLESLVDWLLDGAPGASPPELMARVGRALREEGIPVDRLSAFVSTLHPSVGGRAFRWTPDAPVEVSDLPHGLSSHEYSVVDERSCTGVTDYLALPLVFSDGQSHVVSLASKAPGGFSDAALVTIRRVLRPLARVVEILALRRTASNLLSTYVGRNSGDRILAGHIEKGDFETIRAVIWFSDLRGYTEMSCRLPPRQVIDTLNSVFECQVGSIDRRGGEVLEFTGDGILAIFPLDEVGTNARHLCDLALQAAEEAVAGVERLPSRGPPLRIGVALHVGELAYGNIGGANRLDFTAIGPAVNLSARLETVTAKLPGRPIVCSEPFAWLTTLPTEELGRFELKGVPEPARVFAPRR